MFRVFFRCVLFNVHFAPAWGVLSLSFTVLRNLYSRTACLGFISASSSPQRRFGLGQGACLRRTRGRRVRRARQGSTTGTDNSDQLCAHTISRSGRFTYSHHPIQK